MQTRSFFNGKKTTTNLSPILLPTKLTETKKEFNVAKQAAVCKQPPVFWLAMKAVGSPAVLCLVLRNVLLLYHESILFSFYF